MWSYYGSKTNIVGYYPKPKHDIIIEPFAGAAKYALKYFDRDVILVDKYDVIIKIWKWLQQCSPNDILNLPRKIEKGMNLNNIQFDCEEAKLLMGFLISKGVERPRTTVTDWVAIDRPNFANFLIKKIANNLFKIKHWQIIQGDYNDIINQKATWFIDPPYQHGGHSYPCSDKHIDFAHLASWSKERQGQVIICESMKANWMDFKPLTHQKGRTGMQKEAVWTNDNSFNCTQQTLL